MCINSLGVGGGVNEMCPPTSLNLGGMLWGILIKDYRNLKTSLLAEIPGEWSWRRWHSTQTLKEKG